ncbi:MAG TPA: acyl-CoA thioesterase [Fimbriimonas sp.]
MQAKTVSSTLTVMTEIMQPNDANFLGKVFGGRLLASIDLCAYTTAARFSGEVCVTASFDQVDFHEPIEVGEVVTMTGHITYVGRTSLEVTIEVEAENILEGTRRHTNTARVTMVAVRDGKPVEVPRLVCETRDDKLRFLQGRYRKESRGNLNKARAAAYATFELASDAELDEMLKKERLS